MKKLDSLTALRFFAAASIVIEHSRNGFQSMDWIPIFHYDYGVSFFFVLSGFILCYAYRSFDGAPSVRDFYVARIARIWPLHLFMLCVYLMLVPKSGWSPGWGGGYHAAIIFSNALMIHAWIPISAFFFGLNAVSWSISAEAFFYLMFPVLRNRWAQTWHWKSLLVLSASCAILLISTAYGVKPLNPSDPWAISSEGIGYISPLVRIIEFVMGMLVSNAYVAIQSRKLPESVAMWTVIEVGALALVVLTDRLVGHSYASPWSVFCLESADAPAFAFVVLVFSVGNGLISRLISTRPLVLLGESSFALYLLHLVLYRVFDTHRQLFTVPDAVLCIGYWATAIGVSLLLWRFVETPARDWIRNRARREVVPTSAAI